MVNQGIGQARQQVATARDLLTEQRGTLQEQRGVLSERESEAQVAARQLETARSKLPTPTARRLRQGIFAGLKGRELRRQVISTKEDIKGKESEVKGFQQQLGTSREELLTFEKGLADYEKQIQKAESQIAAYDADIAGREAAKKLYLKGVPYTSVTGPTRTYLKQLYQQGSLIDAAESRRIDEAITGLQDEARMSFTPEIKAKIAAEVRVPSITGPDFSKIFDISKSMPRTDITKDIIPLKSDPPKLFNFFRTTGSPIKIVSALTGNAIRDVGATLPSTSDIPMSSYVPSQSKVPEALQKGFDEQKQEFSPLRIQTGQKIDLPKELRIDNIKEIYDPRINAYISTDPRITTGTSIVTRIPDIEELGRIREAKIRGSIFDRPVSEIRELVKQEKENREQYDILSKKLDPKIKDIEEFGEGKIQGNTWIGSDKELKAYNKKIEDYQKTLSELESIKGVEIKGDQFSFEPETIRVGLPFTLKRDTGNILYEVPISRFTSTSSLGLLGQAGLQVGQVVTEELGKGFPPITKAWAEAPFDLSGKEEFTSPRFFGKKIGDIIKRPDIQIRNALKFRGGEPGIVYDLVSGEARLSTEQDLTKSQRILPGQYKITKQEAGQAGEFLGGSGVSVGRYFTPAAPLFFASDVEQQVRPYNYNPITFAKKEPYEAGLLGGLVLTAGALKIAKPFIPGIQTFPSGLKVRMTGRQFESYQGALRESQRMIATEKAARGSLWTERAGLGVGGTPLSAPGPTSGFVYPPATSLGVSGKVLTKNQIVDLSDQYVKMGIYPTKTEATAAIKRFEIGAQDVFTRPTPALDLRVGTLGDISKRVTLPELKLSPDVGRASGRYFGIMDSTIIGGRTTGLGVTFTKGSRGRLTGIEFPVLGASKGRVPQIDIYRPPRGRPARVSPAVAERVETFVFRPKVLKSSPTLDVGLADVRLLPGRGARLTKEELLSSVFRRPVLKPSKFAEQPPFFRELRITEKSRQLPRGGTTINYREFGSQRFLGITEKRMVPTFERTRTFMFPPAKRTIKINPLEIARAPRKTPFSRTFDVGTGTGNARVMPVTQQASEVTTLPFIPRSGRVKLTVPKSSKIRLAAEESTRPVSAFYGMGMYERTASSGTIPAAVGGASITDISPVTLPPRIDRQLFVPREEVGSRTREEIRPRTEIFGKQRMAPISGVKRRTEQIATQFMGTSSQLSFSEREKIRIAERERQKEVQKEVQRQKGLQRQRERTQTVTTAGFPRRPSGKVPRIKPPKKTKLVVDLDADEKKLKGSRGREEPFLVQIRRFGGWLDVGKFKKKERAVRAGERKALGTLAASLRLKQAGRVVPIDSPSAMFRPSKKEQFVFVQKRGARLGRVSERREIIAARQGGVKWFK